MSYRPQIKKSDGTMQDLPLDAETIKGQEVKGLAFKDTIKNADIANDAAIAQNKIYGLRTDYVASLSVSGKTVTYKNKNGVRLGTITTQDTTYGNATTVYDGLMSSEDKTKLNGIDSNANNYTLPQATRAALGGVKIGYTKNGDNYPVQLSSSGQMFVTVSGGGGGSGSGGGGDSTRKLITTLTGAIDGTIAGDGSGNYIVNSYTFYEDRIVGQVTIMGGGGTAADYIGAMLDFMTHPIDDATSIFDIYSVNNGGDYNFDLTLTADTNIDVGGYTGKYVLLKDCSGFTNNHPRLAFVGDTELSIVDPNLSITEDILCSFTLRFSPRV